MTQQVRCVLSSFLFKEWPRSQTPFEYRGCKHRLEEQHISSLNLCLQCVTSLGYSGLKRNRHRHAILVFAMIASYSLVTLVVLELL